MKQMLWIGCLSFIISLFAVMQPSYADPPLPTPVGRVVWIKGTLTAIMPSKETRTLQKMSVIYLNDILVTDDKSQAQIVFTDNSLMTFHEGTKFSIDQYAHSQNPKKHSSEKYVTTLIEGGFRTITGLIAKDNPVDYQVNTPVATIGVRGTDYAVFIQKDGKLSMARYGGRPCVTGQKKGKTLCLDNTTTQYAQVATAGADPQAVSIRPGVFQNELIIEPATIAPFYSPGGSAQGNQTGGVATSFCIK